MMIWGFYSGNIYFIVEILLAELIFLYPVPKRKLFPLRLGMAFAVMIAVAAFTPRITVIPSVFNDLFRFLFLFALSVVTMGLCFKLEFGVLLSMCSAGYAVQHLAYQTTRLLLKTPVLINYSSDILSRVRLFEIVIMPLIYVIAFFTFGRFSAKNEYYKSSDIRFSILSIVTVFICTGLTRFARFFGESGNITNSLYSIICCLLALYIQFNLHKLFHAKHEAMTIERLRTEEKKQYEISKNAIDAINIKVHDLKHKLSAYAGKLPKEELYDLKHDVEIYDGMIKTGNDTLDVLLTEKSSKCKAEGITLTCAGDCSALSFMKTMDIYSLFGNAVDNAMEAVEKLDNPEKRIVDITIEQRGDLLFFSFTNYCDGNIILENGLPKTTKSSEPSYHGFGMKSMKLIAEKYGGELSATLNGDKFNLSIYITKP
ncbi:MAG: sensor histidine kinase [Clostridia bacterium]|nr:sensor histidine kinase [Clostridia bacterium]